MSSPKPVQKEFTAVSGQFDSRDKIASTHTSELVIALCGPIGSPLHEVAETLKSTLERTFDYEECVVIRLSEFIKQYGKVGPHKSSYERIVALIDAGNDLRRQKGGNVLAELAIHQIRFERQKHLEQSGGTRHGPRRICHIIDSIKNQDELELLRTVYRDMLYVIGVFAPLERREANLRKRGMETPDVYKLVDRDSGEESKIGQTVRDTFPQADFFLRVDSDTDTQLQHRVERYVHLMLGTKIVTPTAGETAMYAAASAAGNSACLSRQVGAAITDSQGEVIATGWNDVPKSGGGLYAAHPLGDPSHDHDKRCWNRDGGKCFNDEEKGLLANAIAGSLVDARLIPEDEKGRFASAIQNDSKVRSLIEFSRSIHAEMHAILNAGKSAGPRLAGGKIFITTYPCHGCARHIIAAGISEVYLHRALPKKLGCEAARRCYIRERCCIRGAGTNLALRRSGPDKILGSVSYEA